MSAFLESAVKAQAARLRKLDKQKRELLRFAESVANDVEIDKNLRNEAKKAIKNMEMSK